MRLKTFRRGTHPADFKFLSMDREIRELKPVGDAVYPLSQHIGASAVPSVAVGDTVLMGQKIAQAPSFVSCNIFSAVSGMVKAIEPRTTVMGETVNSIVIENDGQFNAVEQLGKYSNPTKLDSSEILAKIQEAGLVGMGGAGFPVHVKLAPKEPDKIDSLIINAAECEPYLTSDYRLMLERTDDFLMSLDIMLKLFKNAKCIIGIENNKPLAIKRLEAAISNDRVSVCALKAKYPQGGERMIIKAVTGREINSSMLPCDVGCIVVNVASAIAVYDAVALNTPLIKRVMTVTGDAVKEPGNFLVSIGTNHREVLDAAGGFSRQPKKVISGGPMMGTALFTLDLPVTKTSASILAMSNDEVAAQDTTACIRCGKCVNVCPEKLIPQLMMEYSENDMYADFEKIGGMECIECGCCSYVCPAKRPLTQNFKYCKKNIAAARRKAKEGK